MFVVSVEDDIMVRVETGAWRRPTSAILWPDIWDISAKIKAPHMRSKQVNRTQMRSLNIICVALIIAY